MTDSKGHGGRPRLWAAADDALLKDLYLEGKSTAYLADRFGTSVENVRQRLSRKKVRRPGWTRQSTNPPKRPERPEDIATRLAVLLGETPRPPTPKRNIPDEDLLRYAGERTTPEGTAALWDWVKPYLLRHPLSGPDAVALAKLHGFLAFARELVGV